MPDGKFIVFEGPDGSGQTTQANLLAEYLKSRGVDVLISHEPTDWTAPGKEIVEVLQHRKTMEPWNLQELFVADRKEHLEKEILPALAAGKIVVEDRYIFSTCAFGSLGSDMGKLIKLNEGLKWPDLTLVLRVRPEVSLERIVKRGKPIEFFEKKEKLEKVNAAYADLAEHFPNCLILDGEGTIKNIHQEIVKLVDEKILAHA